jgi:polar amino acid transport system substrate-binding protein
MGARLAVLLAALALMPAPAVAETQGAPLTLLVFERPPYYEPDGQGGFTGLVAGPAAEALERAGIPFQWRGMQPNGHLRAVQADQAPVCAVGWFRTPEREAYARFSDPIYRDGPLVVLTRADADGVMVHDTLRDLFSDPALRFGAKLGYAFGAEIDAMIRTLNPPRTTASQDDAGLARMLLGGRFDYMLVGGEEAEPLIGSFGEAGQDLVTMTLPDIPDGNTRHLVCSRSVAPETIARFNAALAAPSRTSDP